MNKILLPTDYSESSLMAIEYASKLFDDHACEFHIIHAYRLSRSGLAIMRKQYTETREYRKSESAAREDMRKMLLELKKKYEADPHIYRGFVTAQSLTDGIRQSVLELQGDLIVMATTGASGLKEVFLGSNAVKVINRMKDCPVLLVPAGYSFVPVRKILFVNDFRRNFEAEEVLALASMARMTTSSIALLYINDGNEFTSNQKKNREELLRLLEGIPVEEQQMPMDKFLSDIIEDYTASGEVNMLAMIKNKHSNLDKLLREPVVKKVAFHSRIPFLVMPEVV
ncbi:universal stress protein [Robertkochia flava]|uniref:universal stress protein n=1 Tax=Robertkochia flava TaxID=3447986 RepID=UPI001CCA1FCE|nr:universal stress protein [Robertkochia marina]